MSFSVKTGFFFSLFVFVQIYNNANSQQIDASTINQLKKQYSTDLISSSQASKVLKKLKPDSSSYLDSLSKDTTDSLLKDSLNQKKIDSIANLSIYEKLLRGININPDSLLSNLTIYGYDVFRKNKPSTFVQNDNVSVPSNYPINAGDEIVVMLWGRMNEEYKLKVNRDGTINIPHFGPVSVAGLSFNEMEQNILDRIGKIEGVNATVSMGELRSIGVYIVGEVVSPGFYTISALSNVTNALFAAGGPTKNGSLRNIQLCRNGKCINNIDFYDFLMSGYDHTSLRLQAGDVIHVPIVKDMAAIAGNVRRSALYELKGKASLNDLINLAGGITPAAWTNRIQVERFTRNQYKVVLDIDSTQGKLPSFSIQDGDVVKVFPILIKDTNAVILSGNVLRPGKYEFKNALRVTDIINGYQSLLPETYFNYAVILRQDPPSYLSHIVAFNLKQALEDPNSKDNVLLQQRDQIVVYHQNFFEPDRSVTIEGAVTNPGKFKLFENMKIRDLILQAGGLSDEASLSRGEVYRRINDHEKTNTEKIDFSVSLAMQDDTKNNLSLQRTDRIFIRSKKGWEEERKITLKGQFQYPGVYVLFEGENLGDLIKRAGGFKDNAYLSAAVFTRVSVKTLEQKRIEDYNTQLQSDLMKLSTELAAKENSDEAQQLLLQQTALQEKNSKNAAVGRVVIDLTNLDKYSDFALENGDSLYVPRNLNTISVLGEVYNPSTFKYEGQFTSVSTYLNAAGGLKETSDKKHIYVIRANGSILTDKRSHISNYVLQPGDAIVVPQKIKYSNPHKFFVDSVDAIFKISSVIGTVITLIITAAALNNSNKN